MGRVGAWELHPSGPRQLGETGIDLEAELERWIREDPALIQAGLSIISQQLHVDGTRARLDLLALDLQGRWVIIEIKRGPVMRETIAQALDYAACVSEMPGDDLERRIDPQRFGHTLSLREMLQERDALESLNPAKRNVSLLLVGTARTPELDRLVNFLASKFRLPISVVTFQVFKTHQGSHILVREINEPTFDEPDDGRAPTAVPTVEELIELARRSGVGPQFESLYQAATQLGLNTRPWKTSIMYTPPANRTRCLFTAWTTPVDGKLKVAVAQPAFTEFFQIDDAALRAALGQDGWRRMDDSELDSFIAGLHKLLGNRST